MTFRACPGGSKKRRMLKGGNLLSQVLAIFAAYPAANGFLLSAGINDGFNFQDPAGTTPVTALEQTVGLAKDRSGRGNHFVQNTSTARVKVSARVNLLTNSAWAGGGAAPTGWTPVIGTGTSAPNGMLADGSIVYRQTAGAQRPVFVQAAALALGTSGSLIATAYVGTVYSGTPTVTDLIGWQNLPSGATVSSYTLDGATVLSTAPVTGNQRVGCVVTSGGTAGSVQVRVGLGNAGNITADLDISRPQVDIGTVATRYQRTGTSPATGDYDSAGFPIRYVPDGVDDFFVSAANLDLSGTDKMFFCAGARKFSDAAVGVLMETSVNANTNNGSFFVIAPASNGANTIAIQSKAAGSPVAVTAGGAVAPMSFVASSQLDIGGNSLSMRVNGGSTLTTATAQGGGNLGSYPAYLLMRAGSALPFQGGASMISALGAIPTAAEQLTFQNYANSLEQAY